MIICYFDKNGQLVKLTKKDIGFLGLVSAVSFLTIWSVITLGLGILFEIGSLIAGSQLGFQDFGIAIAMAAIVPSIAHFFIKFNEDNRLHFMTTNQLHSKTKTKIERESL